MKWTIFFLVKFTFFTTISDTPEYKTQGTYEIPNINDKKEIKQKRKHQPS